MKPKAVGQQLRDALAALSELYKTDIELAMVLHRTTAGSLQLMGYSPHRFDSVAWPTETKTTTREDS